MAGTSNSSDAFEEAKFMKELVNLKETQEAVQCLSGWCIRNRKHSYKIARCWLKCAKKVKTEQRLTLFYLLNDVVQNSKRKNYNDLIEKFEGILKEIMPYLKEEKIAEKVQRCLDIWAERQVFTEKFVSELSAMIKKNKEEQELIDNFQPQQLCTQIKIMRALEDDTDYKLKTLKEADLNLVEMDEAALRQNLKDRQHGSDFIHEVDEGKQRLEQYIKAVDREINKRRQVIELLTLGSKYYESLLGEANIVANAYSNFGKRVKSIQAKLVEDRLPSLKIETKQSLLAAADLSPIPSPDYDAPSPESEDLELVLPDEQQHMKPSTSTKRRSASPVDFNSRLDSMRSQMAAVSQYATVQGDGQQQAPTPIIAGSSVVYANPATNPLLAASAVYATPAVNQILGSTPTFSEPVEPSQAWWDPPPATSWPAPKPDLWSDTAGAEQEPIPEWQIQPEDDVPDDDDDVIPETYTQNLALQRLQQNSAKAAITAKAPADNLISLTSGKLSSTVEDMEMCSDSEEDYGGHSRHHHHHESSRHLHDYRKKAPDFGPNGLPDRVPESYKDEERRTLSLQERLKSLAGMGSSAATGGTESEPAMFSSPPPPMPMSAPSPSIASISLPPTTYTPSRPPPPPPHQNFGPRNPRFDSPQQQPPRARFQSPDFRPHNPRPRHDSHSSFSPMRGVPGNRGTRPPGPRW